MTEPQKRVHEVNKERGETNLKGRANRAMKPAPVGPRHVCGLSGFGVGVGSSHDVCYACEQTPAERKTLLEGNDRWRVAQEESRLPWTDPNLVYRAMNVIEAARGGHGAALASALAVWDELAAFYGVGGTDNTASEQSFADKHGHEFR